MSLKAFHIVFICLSILLAFGCAVWALITYSSGGSPTLLLAAAGAVICGIGLIIYGIRFLKKLKNVNFL